MERKYYRVTEKEMDLICSIINLLIERSPGAQDGEYSVEDSGMGYSPLDKTWGFVCGGDLISDTVSPEAAEEEICNSLEFVFHDCIPDINKEENNE